MAKSDNIDLILQVISDMPPAFQNALDINSVRMLARPSMKAAVADATTIAFIDGKKRDDDAVLVMSGPAHPEAVLDDVNAAKAIAKCLDTETQRHIITPLLVSHYNTQSFALLPRLSSLSDNKVVRLLEKRARIPNVVTWLASVAQQTRQPCANPAEFKQAFQRPLESLQANPRMPAQIQDSAHQCLIWATQHTDDLFLCAEHGDFWSGNIMYRPHDPPQLNPFSKDFVVIDWAGARMNGYPCIDLVRLCQSAFKPGTRPVSRAISLYCNALKIEVPHVYSYVLASLGMLGLNLNQFPEDRYIELCDRVFWFLKEHGLTIPTK